MTITYSRLNIKYNYSICAMCAIFTRAESFEAGVSPSYDEIEQI